MTESFVSHTNLGATYLPRARSNDGARANLTLWNAGQSVIWLVHPRFNVMLEWVYLRSQSVISAGRVATESSTFISPGFRWAHNFASGLQIVPGIAFLSESARAAEKMALLYTSTSSTRSGGGACR